MQRNPNHTTIVTVEKVIEETPTVRTLVYSDDVMPNVLPGQFAMVWIPGVNELPMSVMISQESGKAAFTKKTWSRINWIIQHSTRTKDWNSWSIWKLV